MLSFPRLARLAVLSVALAIAAPAAADDRLDLFLRGFDEMALWHDNKIPVAVRKWRTPVRVRLTGPMSSSYDDLVMQRLNKIAGIAGISVERLPAAGAGENFLVAFDESSGYMIGGRMAGCYAQTRPGASGEIVHAKLVINLRVGSGLRRCITHELMHAVGFPGHPHGLNTVLSYVHQQDDLTEIDVMSLRVLYDQRITLGMYHLPALLTARAILAGRLGLDNPEALGRRYLDSAVRYLTEEAEKGNVFVQTQLGNAYFFSQYVEKDEAQAVSWWRRAAEGDNTNAIFRLGYATATGRGTLRDDQAALDLYRKAAERGHTYALYELAVFYLDGRVVERDPVMAYALMRVAGERGYKVADTSRAKLAAGLTAEQIAEGDRRAAAWKPQQ